MYAYLKNGQKVKISRETAVEIEKMKRQKSLTPNNYDNVYVARNRWGDFALYIEIDEVIAIQ